MPKQTKIRPPVKWHGGKYYLADWIISQMPPHSVYVEPFGGAASVLLNKPRCDLEVYGDLDPQICNLFTVIRDHTADFIHKLQLTPYSEYTWQQACLASPKNVVDLAVANFTKWRQSIGGRGVAFSYSLHRCRRGMADVVSGWLSAIDQLQAVSDRLQDIIIRHEEAVEVIRDFDGSDALIYCDPPYVHSTRKSIDVYDAEMPNDKHVELAEFLNSCKSKVMISGYQSALYSELFRSDKWRMVEKSIPNHSSKSRSKDTKIEMIWMNF